MAEAGKPKESNSYMEGLEHLAGWREHRLGGSRSWAVNIAAGEVTGCIAI